MSQGLISAIKVGCAKRGRACLCNLALESIAVLVYILNIVHTVLFLYQVLKVRGVNFIPKSNAMNVQKLLSLCGYGDNDERGLRVHYVRLSPDPRFLLLYAKILSATKVK